MIENMETWRIENIETVKNLAWNMLHEMTDDPVSYRQYWLDLYRQCSERLTELASEMANV